MKQEDIKKNIFIKEILSFYEEHKREFIWRKGLSPWQILVSEILLQKTNAGKVENFILKVLKELNTPNSTLTITLKELEALLKPFGMYQVKAERIKKIANMIVNQYKGKVPCNEKDLLSLPGVGRYIADAVLCFSCGIDKAVVDVNTIRVVTRYFGIKSKYSRPRNDPQLYNFIQSLIPTGKCKEFNWGLIDFSAKICKLKPKCSMCLLKKNCMFFNSVLRNQ